MPGGGYQITIKIHNSNKAKNLQGLAQQLANVVEGFTKRRTIINVKDLSNVRKR